VEVEKERGGGSNGVLQKKARRGKNFPHDSSTRGGPQPQGNRTRGHPRTKKIVKRSEKTSGRGGKRA